MGNAVHRNLRLECRTVSAKSGANSFQFCGSDTSAPTFAVGDAYGAVTELAVGSDTSPGSNTVSRPGNATVSGSLASQSGITITKGTSSCIAADNGGTVIILQ